MRNFVLDALRGLIVFLACIEHFSFYLNFWYLDRFDSSQIFSIWLHNSQVDRYLIHNDHIGMHLPITSPTYLFFCRFLIPWVTHLFIALAGYNLARRSSSEVRQKLRPKVGFYLALFMIFSVENMIVASNFGMAITMFPIALWMLLLALTCGLYAFCSTRVLAGLFVVSLGLRLLENIQVLDLAFVSKLAASVHPWANGSAEPMVYLPSALFGLLVGRYLFSNANSSRSMRLGAVVSGIALLGFAWLARDGFAVNPGNVFESDEVLTRMNAGMGFIFSALTLVLIGVHQASRVKLPRAFSTLEWIGRNSIGIFFIHRILFLKVLAPIRFHIGSIFGWTMTNFFTEHAIYFLLIIGIFRYLQKVRFFGPLMGQSNILE